MSRIEELNLKPNYSGEFNESDYLDKYKVFEDIIKSEPLNNMTDALKNEIIVSFKNGVLKEFLKDKLISDNSYNTIMQIVNFSEDINNFQRQVNDLNNLSWYVEYEYDVDKYLEYRNRLEKLVVMEAYDLIAKNSKVYEYFLSGLENSFANLTDKWVDRNALLEEITMEAFDQIQVNGTIYDVSMLKETYDAINIFKNIDPSKLSEKERNEYNKIKNMYDKLDLERDVYQNGKMSEKDLEEFNELHKEIVEEIKNFAGDKKNSPGEIENADGFQRYSDPIIINFGDNFEFTTIEGGTNFDLDGNGTKEKTAWVKGNNGFLVFDKNDNDIVDSRDEMFTDNILMGDNEYSKSGYDLLKKLDTNNDGIINIDDDGFENLKVWFDSNTNGYTDNNELVRLVDLGVVEISLDKNFDNLIRNEDVNQSYSLHYKTNDGRKGLLGEFWFLTNKTFTRNILNIKISDDVKILPNIRSYGLSYNLHTEIMLDESGELKSLVEKFINVQDENIKLQIMDEIMFIIADAKDIDPNSKGSYVDARELKTLEYFTDSKFPWSIPNRAEGYKLKINYQNFKDIYYNNLIKESVLKDLPIYYIGTSNLLYDPKGLLKEVEKITNGNLDEFKYLVNYTTGYLLSREKFLDVSGSKDFVISIYNAGYSLDEIFESNRFSNILIGSKEDDRFNSNSDSAIFYGGKGDDYMIGRGDDIYFFGKGDGRDTIEDYSGDDTIVFGKGVNKEDLRFKMNGYHLEIGIVGTEDKLTIKNFAYMSRNRSRKIGMEFGDVRLELEDIISLARSIYGTEGDDYLVNFDDGDYIMRGEAGNDNIYTSSGNDILEGGKGDDYLSGNSGDDTYIINLGDGNDTIYDYSGTDKIVFGEGISKENLTVEKEDRNLILTIGESGETVTIRHYFYYGMSYEEQRYRLEEFVFANNDKLCMSDIIDLALGVTSKVASAPTYQINANVLIQEMSSFVDKDNIYNETTAVINSNNSEELFINKSIDYKNA